MRTSWQAEVQADLEHARDPAPAGSRVTSTPVPGLMPDDPAFQDTQLRRRGWMFAAIWLIYLAQPFGEAWDIRDPARRYLGMAAVTAFGLLFLTTFYVARMRRARGKILTVRTGILVVAGQAVIVAAGLVVIGQDAIGLLVYIAVMAVFLLPSPAGWGVVAASIAAAVTVPHLVHGWQADWSMGFQIFVAGLAMWAVVQIIQRNTQLSAAHSEITRLALLDERNRFARDLHDILGHSLTVVAIKAELAGRLVRLSPERAEAEIADLERIARQSLADVRAAAAGYREVTLADELASARTALAAAGIEAELPGDEVARVPRARQELLGSAVREGVTNVIRHSGASSCTIRVTSSEVEISDDGRGPAAVPGAEILPADSAGVPGTCPQFDVQQPGDQPLDGFPDEANGRCPGHGLAGLGERAAAVGGTVTVGRSAAGGFLLLVRVP